MALTLRLGASHIRGAASRRAFGISRVATSRQLPSQHRRLYSTGAPDVQLTAPNGRTWSQPTGLFINNEFVPSTDGQMITTVNPTYDTPALTLNPHPDPSHPSPPDRR